MRKAAVLIVAILIVVSLLQISTSAPTTSIVIPEDTEGCCVLSNNECLNRGQLFGESLKDIDLMPEVFDPEKICKQASVKRKLDVVEWSPKKFCGEVESCRGCCLYNGKIATEIKCEGYIPKEIDDKERASKKFWDPNIKDPEQCKQSIKNVVVDINKNGFDDRIAASEDIDGDELLNSLDNCPFVSNPLQENDDGDRFGNVCDNCQQNPNDNQQDSDHDGVGDVCDNCPDIYGSGETCEDTDADGKINRLDNCPNVWNPQQEDTDMDRKDPQKIQGDEIGNVCDNCPHVWNFDQKDSDSDGIGDLCDAYPFISNNGEFTGPTIGLESTPDCKEENLGEKKIVRGVCSNCTRTYLSSWTRADDKNCVKPSNDNGNTKIGGIAHFYKTCEDFGVQKGGYRWFPSDGCFLCKDSWTGFTWQEVDKNFCEEKKTSYLGPPQKQDFLAFLGPVKNLLSSLFQPILAFFSGVPKIEIEPYKAGSTEKNLVTISTQVPLLAPTFPDKKVEVTTRVNIINRDNEDRDTDGILNSFDNCPDTSNQDQKDSDNDGVGDKCDKEPENPAIYTVITPGTTIPSVQDPDGDGIADQDDNCPTKSNQDQKDSDKDGEGDVCDSTPSGSENNVIPGERSENVLS